MINFVLNNIDEIHPVGTPPDLHISWFWLTDANLWLNFGESTIYEYSDEAMSQFGSKPTRYNDYPLSRFIEDFTSLFSAISESVPFQIWGISENLNGFYRQADEWMEKYDTNNDEISEFYFNEYHSLINWASSRTLNSGHLMGGPNITFIRFEDQIRIIWSSDANFENGFSIWKFKSGHYDMKYADFIKQVELFRDSFFEKMDLQISLASNKNWGEIEFDRIQLANEHQERKLTFDEQLSNLIRVNHSATNWAEITGLYNRMKDELKI